MGILATINGNDCGDDFLVAPHGDRTFPVFLILRTDDGSVVNAELQLLPGGASVQLSTTSVEVSPTETRVELRATSQSSRRGDTNLQIMVDGKVHTSCYLTAIADLKVGFRGRFQARFATGSDPYNEPRGNSDPQAVFKDPNNPALGRWGWTWALEGEPDFVPTDSVADPVDKPVGRVVRFHNPAALRPHVPSIGVQVASIRGALSTGSEAEFTAGDPIIGRSVNLGPHSYFAGNRPSRPGDQPPAESHADAREPIANFEFHIGGVFSGGCADPSDRPITPQDPSVPAIVQLTDEERTKFGVVPLDVLNAQRRAMLLNDYNTLSEADRTGTTVGRNLAARIAFLGGAPEAGIPPSVAFRRTLAAGYNGKEQFTGIINAAITVAADFSPVAAYLAGFDGFIFAADFFNFHSDELCGQVNGHISGFDGDEGLEARAEVSAIATAIPLSRLQPEPEMEG
jgi:hypothetical protein